jgi:hypothetical protein
MSEEVTMSPVPAPPPPSERLRALVASGGAVSLRAPGRELLLAAFVFLAWGAIFVMKIGVRRDLPALPMPPYLMSAAAWAVTAMLALVVAMLPARGQVLPSVSRARIAMFALPLAGVAIAAMGLVDAPALSLYPSRVAHFIGHCLGIGLAVSVVPVAIAIYLARAQLVVGRGSLGALFGVAAGLLAALVLHGVCPVAGITHMLLGHAGVVVLAACVGAGLARYASRERR